MFSIHTTLEEFKNVTLPVVLSGKSRDYRDVIIAEKLRFQTVLLPLIPHLHQLNMFN